MPIEVSKLQEGILLLYAERDKIQTELDRLTKIRTATSNVTQKAKAMWENLHHEYFKATRELDDTDPLEVFMLAAKVREAHARWMFLDNIDTGWYNKREARIQQLGPVERRIEEHLHALVTEKEEP